MADAGRQSFTDKAASAMKVCPYGYIDPLRLLTILLQPDSQKSYAEQIGDSLKGTADSVASSVQPQVRPFHLCHGVGPDTHGALLLPQSGKSTTQKMGDTVNSNSNENQVSDLCSPPVKVVIESMHSV